MSWIKTSYVKYPEYKRQSSLPKEQVNAVVARLNVIKTLDDNGNATNEGSKQLTKEKIGEMLERLADAHKNKEKTPERQRTGADRDMGIVNSYAWMSGRELKRLVSRGDGNWN